MRAGSFFLNYLSKQKPPRFTGAALLFIAFFKADT